TPPPPEDSVLGCSLLVIPPSPDPSVLPSRVAEVPSEEVFAADPVAQLACAPTTAPPTTSMRNNFLKSTVSPWERRNTSTVRSAPALTSGGSCVRARGDEAGRPL